MVAFTKPPPALFSTGLSLYYAADPLLANSRILIFYGGSTATGLAGPAGSRIQAHVYTPAGAQYYPRLSISPASASYDAVKCLPRDDQGDEISRALAFILYKYLAELPQSLRDVWTRQMPPGKGLPVSCKLFGAQHAANVACKMWKVVNVEEVIQGIQSAWAEQSISWLDVDIVLPPGSMKTSDPTRDSDLHDEVIDDAVANLYGQYAPLVKLFGEPAFIPTSRLRRAPSRPLASSKRTFGKQQKETLRREMCELVDTEENYVSKLDELVNEIARPLRQKAMERKTGENGSSSTQAITGLFPPSIDRILQVNSTFLSAVQKVLEETEEEAMKDLDSDNQGASEGSNDHTGVLGVAQCLLAHLPNFAACYADYIQAHANFGPLLRTLSKDPTPEFSKQVQERGEQRLMSLLIEPVQRLPRYSLYIDNMIKQLPARHVALKSLLKTRDLVADICSQDEGSSERSSVIDRLQQRIHAWPPTLRPKGRLVSAVDIVEVMPPYYPNPEAEGSVAGILLLFTDYIFIVWKATKRALSARSLVAQVTQSSAQSDGSDSARSQLDLIVSDYTKLEAASITELQTGKLIQIVSCPSPVPGMAKTPNELRARVFYLCGPYEGKSYRLAEELVKARIEGRFSEAERDSSRWEAWSVQNQPGGIAFFAAVFEDAEGIAPRDRGAPAKVQIVVDPAKDSKPMGTERQEVEISAILTLIGNESYELEVIGHVDRSTKDRVTAAEFLPVLSKRLTGLFQTSHQITSPALTECLLHRNHKSLQALKTQKENAEVEDDENDAASVMSFAPSRPLSPVKMLSSLFGSGSAKETNPNHDSRPPKTYSTNALSDVPRLAPPIVERPPSSNIEASTITRPTSSDGNAKHIDRLEQTLWAYLLALHARKGNIVGTRIRARANADELSVNELYNTLLEDPSNHSIAAHMPIDVVFAAFEKFLRAAWRQKLGPVVTRATLAAINNSSSSLFSADFQEHVRTHLDKMAPQNKKAFTQILRLLADLLDGTGNDGDRGILTAAFAELLVTESNAHDYMSLLDHFVEDLDVLIPEAASSEQESNSHAATHGTRERARSVNTGSIGSNTSSLRKRFGFGNATLARENSRSEQESKVHSVWRSLSKTTKERENQPSSLGKSPLHRHRSVDVDSRSSNPRPPPSRERPTLHGTFGFEDGSVNSRDVKRDRSLVFAAERLETIGESSKSPAASPPRKKRRSSLSDVERLIAHDTAPSWSPDMQKRHEHVQPDSPQRTPSQRAAPEATRAAVSPHPNLLMAGGARHGSPTRQLPPPNRKENSPNLSRNGQRDASNNPASSPTASRSAAKAREGSASGIPTLKPGPLTERKSSGNIMKPPPLEKTASPLSSEATAQGTVSPKRLRMQSPQKLRERLQTEQRAIATADVDIQQQLMNIGDELSGIKRSPARASAIVPSGKTATLDSLQTKLHSLTATHRTTIAELRTRTTQVETDLRDSLTVSETRARKLDELYREANAENEALYARFNDELARVLGKVRGGEGVEELKRSLAESREEGSRWKREVGKLRREVVGLRSQLKEHCNL